MSSEIEVPDDEWQSKLTPEQYSILRKGGTERAFTGKYVDCHDDGTYRCAGCETVLFRSDTKFDSGSGWPSFTEPANTENITFVEDRDHGMVRTEVRCAKCDGHLGHVFPDGPADKGGMRYCINSLSLELEPDAR